MGNAWWALQPSMARILNKEVGMMDNVEFLIWKETKSKLRIWDIKRHPRDVFFEEKVQELKDMLEARKVDEEDKNQTQ